MCKILNKKAKFTFWCNLNFRFLQLRLYYALYWSRAPYIRVKLLLSAKWSTSLSTIESITPKSRIKNHETKWKNLFWCFVKPKLILWIVDEYKTTENYLPFDRCFLLHVASFPFRLQYWAMVYSKNATKTNVSQPNIQMSIA